jgi:hypothetical protein
VPIDFAVAHSSHKISSRLSSVAQLHKYEFPHDAEGERRRGLHVVQLFYRMRGGAMDRLRNVHLEYSWALRNIGRNAGTKTSHLLLADTAVIPTVGFNGMSLL